MSSVLFAAGLSGLGLGASLIIAIGAQNAYVLRQGLRRNHVFEVASLCFVIDCTLIAAGAGGFASLIDAVPGLPALAAWAGAAFLLAYGGRAFWAALSPGTLTAENGDPPSQSLRAAVMTALALSLLNPHVYLDTIILLGGIAAQYPSDQRIAFAAGAMIASGLWFYSLGFGARRLAPLFARPAAWRLLDLAVGMVMWAIAGGLVWSQIKTM